MGDLVGKVDGSAIPPPPTARKVSVGKLVGEKDELGAEDTVGCREGFVDADGDMEGSLLLSSSIGDAEGVSENVSFGEYEGALDA